MESVRCLQAGSLPVGVGARPERLPAISGSLPIMQHAAMRPGGASGGHPDLIHPQELYSAGMAYQCINKLMLRYKVIECSHIIFLRQEIAILSGGQQWLIGAGLEEEGAECWLVLR